MFNRNKEMGEKNKSEIDRIQGILSALEAKSVEAENDISEIKSDLEPLRMNLTLSNSRQKQLKEKIEDIQKQIDELKSGAGSAPVISSDGAIDPS